MTVNDPDEHRKTLQKIMEISRTVRQKMGVPSKFHYAGAEDFVLQHGTWFKPGPLPVWIKEGAPRLCYGNAIMNCVLHPELRYIEGYAINQHGIPVPIQHAWNTDDKGTLIDNTWMNRGCAYIGVEFSLGRADHSTWEDDATVLDNPNNHYAIYLKPWKGEDYSIRWKESQALKVARIALAAKQAGVKVTFNRSVDELVDELIQE